MSSKVKCDEWTGPSGFKYWTVGRSSPIYSFGHDIVLQDGPANTWSRPQVDGREEATPSLVS